VLFTFPILNGIAIIASDQPTVVADAIYPLVIFNCVLFAALITYPRALPPVGALPRWGRLFARIIVWTLAWLAGALVLTRYRNAIPDGGFLLAGATVLALAFMAVAWSRGARTETPSPHNHARRFIAFWCTSAGLWRVIFFVATYAVLFFVAHAAQDQKWVGMSSALPLPGFFALATLIDDAEEASAPMTTLLPIRDTLFLGPVLVIPFNWFFSHALMSVLPRDAILLHYSLLLAMWAAAAAAVVWLVPRLAARRDRS
jgi:hypothetical protein